MKCIFLDIDGVLNNSRTYDSDFGYVGMDDMLIRRLKKITAASNAKIYLISSWKYGWYKDADKKSEQDIFADYLDSKFYGHGLLITDKLESGNSVFDFRGKLVKEFLQTNEVEKFVILDDVKFDYIDEGFENNLVLTNSKYGLTEEDVKKALEILK